MHAAPGEAGWSPGEPLGSPGITGLRPPGQACRAPGQAAARPPGQRAAWTLPQGRVGAVPGHIVRPGERRSTGVEDITVEQLKLSENPYSSRSSLGPLQRAGLGPLARLGFSCSWRLDSGGGSSSAGLGVGNIKKLED